MSNISNLDECIKNKLEEVENYKETINILIALRKYFENRCEFFAVSRKLKTSENKDITPDILIQFNPTYGVIGEIKQSFPKDMTLWLEDFKQIKKYDDDLKGWKTVDEKIMNHNLVLFTHMKFAPQLKNYIATTLKKYLTFHRKFSLCSYARIEQRATYYLFRKEYGTLSYEELNKAFDEQIIIYLNRILDLISKIRFYDVKPPLPYLMEVLWDHVFNTLILEEKFREYRGKVIEITTTVDEIFEKAKFQFGSWRDEERQPPQIYKDWIIDALQKLEELKLVKKLDNNKYKIRYKRIPEDTLKFFCTELCKKELRIEEKLLEEEQKKLTEIIPMEKTKT